MKKKIIFSALLYSVAPKLPQLINILILPIISPYLTLGDFGVFGVIWSYLALFYILISLGLNVVLQNSYYEHKSRFYVLWSKLYGLMTISGSFISVIFMLILHFILPPDQMDKYWSIVLLITIYLVLSPLETITTTYYTLKGNALPLVIRTFCSGILVAIVNIYTIKYLHMGYVGWLIGSAIASIFLLLSCIYPFWIKRKIFPSFKLNVRKHWKTLKVGFLVIPHNISMYIFNTSDRVLLNVFKVSTNSIGLYSQGYNIGSYGSYLITGVFSALTPQIQSAYREGRKKDLRFLFMGIQLLLSSILFVIALWIKEVFLLLFKTPELQHGNSVAVIILCAYMFWPMYAFVTIPLFIKKITGLIYKLTGIAALLNVTLNLIFIPKYGILSALYVTYISYIVFSFTCFIFRDSRKVMNEIFGNALLYYLGFCFINLIFATVAFNFGTYPFIIKLVLSVFGVIIALVGSKLIFKKNV